MGENGAGKSTLIKVLTGVYGIDAGTIRLDGEPAVFAGPGAGAAGRDQHRLPGGQPLREPLGRGEHLPRPRAAPARPRSTGGRMRRRAAELLARLDLDIDALGARRVLARRPADGRHRPGHRHRRRGAHPRRADLQPRRRRGRAAVPGHARAARRRASRSCSSRTSSTRSTRSPTGSRCCATAGWSASTRSPSCPRSSWSKMIGKELDALERPGRAAADRRRRAARTTPVLEAAGLGRTGAIAPFNLAIHPGEVRRPGRAARLRPHRGGPAAVRRRPRRRAARVARRRQAGRAAQPARRHRRTASRSARRTARARASSASSPCGRTSSSRCRPPAAGPGRSPGARRTSWSTSTSRRCDIRPADPEALVAQPHRRQPAEGAAGPLADHRAAAADPRRADPRHRRRRQGRDPEARRRALRRRHGGAVHLRRAGGGAAAQPQDRRAARPADGRRARQRRRRVDADRIMRDHRERSGRR